MWCMCVFIFVLVASTDSLILRCIRTPVHPCVSVCVSGHVQPYPPPTINPTHQHISPLPPTIHPPHQTTTQSSAKLPRPVNPYVKLKLGTTELRTNVLTNTKNPVWGGQVRLSFHFAAAAVPREGKVIRTHARTISHPLPFNKMHTQDATHSRFRFRCPDPNALLRVTVGDWKIGKNLWIARLALPLASIEITTDPRAPGVSKTYALRLRVSRFGKHIEREGASDAKLVLRLKYEHPERAWTMQVRRVCKLFWMGVGVWLAGLFVFKPKHPYVISSTGAQGPRRRVAGGGDGRARLRGEIPSAAAARRPGHHGGGDGGGHVCAHVMIR